MGSKNFTEQLILGELFAQMLEHFCRSRGQTAASISREPTFASRRFLPDASTSIPNTPAPRWRPCSKQNASGDATQVYEEVKREYRQTDSIST